MRLGAREASGQWQSGTPISVGISGDDAVAFPPSA
jgi:hypothetical protein